MLRYGDDIPRTWLAHHHFLDDHEPAHVHVFGDGHLKINLIGSNGAPELIWAEDMKRSEIRRALKIVAEQQASFLAR